ncbi:plant expansin [Thelephora terrestris]|uniref:Plant expansin n=1 Tax=Thelephora terrestris TaxID=56493 RepID=A0A9P6HR90_9AGAM|nr:plant expansin [Thelephora terrestris]
MRFSLSLPVVALSYLVAGAAADPHGGPHARRHDSIARRAPGDVSAHLQKRFDNARWTFYDVGLYRGACGQNSVASDFMVALNSAQFGSGYPGPYCFQQITMTYNGMTTTATILDECPGCPYGGLDLSRGLFDFFSSESAGVIYGTWNFVGANQPAPSPTTTTPAWTPPTTTQQAPSPTTTSTPQPTPTTSTWSPSPSASSWSESSSSPPPASSSSSPPSSVNYSSGPASNLAVPTPATISDSSPHNLLTMNEDLIALGALVVAGANVH